jgi:hypothetical protein
MSYQPPNSNDAKQLLRSTLMADSTVASMVDDRVHGAHLQDPDAGGAVYPLVVIDFQGGGVAGTSGLQSISVEVWAYSRQSAGNALEIYDACFAALHYQKLRRDGVLLAGYAYESVRPAEGWNENTRGYYAMGIFTVIASYRAAS